jgi:hypothetical protein
MLGSPDRCYGLLCVHPRYLQQFGWYVQLHSVQLECAVILP